MNGLVRRCYLVGCIVGLLFFQRASCVSAQDLRVVGTTQQTNERIQELGTPPKSASPHEYTIGYGDLLSISVFDVPDLSREVRVSQLGTISIPLVPTRINVVGLTESQAEQVIAEVLQANGLVTHPEVAVLVKEHKSKPITIVGAVAHPLVYDAEQNVTLLEALAAAGGVTNDAGDTVIVTHARPAFVMTPAEPIDSSGHDAAPGAADSLEPARSVEPSTTAEAKPNAQTSTFPSGAEMERNSAPATLNSTAAQQAQTAPATDGSVVTVNLNQLIETGDTRNNILLKAGDVVTVPHAGIVYVLGAVNRPGGFVLANDRTEMTTMKVLALAGGFTKIAKLDHAVIIRKDDQGKQTETEVDLKKIVHQQEEDVQMRASDVLYIPDNNAKAVLLQAVQIAVAVATAVAIYRIGYQ